MSENHDGISIRRYLLALAVLCVTIAFAFSIYIAQLDRTTEAETEMYLAEIGEQGAQNIRDRLMLLMSAVRTSASLLGKTPNILDTRLMTSLSVKEHRLSFSSVAVATPDGKAHYGNGLVVDISKSKFFELAMYGRANISEPFDSPISGARTIIFAAPIYSEESKLRGVFYAALSKEEFRSIFTLSFFSGAGYSYIIDKSGEIVTDRDDGLNNQAPPTQSELAEICSHPNEIMKRDIGGSTKYIHCINIGINQWQLISMIPKDTVSARFAGFLYITNFAAGFLFIFFAVISLLIAKALSDKNKKLHGMMNSLSQSEERYKIIMDNTDSSIFEWNVASNSLYCSPSFMDKFPSLPTDGTAEDKIFKTDMLSEEDVPTLRSLLAELSKGKRSLGEIELRLRTKGDVRRWCRVTFVASESEGDRRIFGMLSDIDDEHRERQKLMTKAQTDGLTGLYDKLTTQEMIKSYLDSDGHNGRHVMVMVDLDNFKTINDTNGHLFGDTTLKRTGEHMKRIFRSDDITGRIGGDEFMLFLKNVGDTDFIKRKMRELGETIKHCMDDEKAGQISVSIGVAVYPSDADDFDGLYKAADDALYQAKRSGKDCFAIYDSAKNIEPLAYDKAEREISLLLIYKNEEDRLALRRILETEYSVIDTDDKDKAIKILRSVSNVGAVLVAPNDAIESAPDMIRDIKASYAGAGLAIIFTTSVHTHEESERLLAAGATDYILKPYAADSVRARVRSAIGQSMLEHMERERSLHKDLSDTTSRLQLIIDTVQCGIAVLKLKKDFTIETLFVSEYFCQLSGSTREQVLGTDILSFVTSSDRHIFVEAIRDIMANDTKTMEKTFRINHRSGRTVWVQARSSQYRDDYGAHIIHLALIDITREVEERERKEKEAREVRYRSRHDKLTGIYNSDTFFSETEAMLASDPNTQYVMLCWDIDRFKVVNDLFGNEAGDSVLKELASVFINMHADHVMRYGRIGGDIFAACLPYRYFDTEDCMNRMPSKFKALDDKYEVSICMGVYVIDDPTLSASVMCDRANIALRTVKGSYTHRYAIYGDTLRDKMLTEQMMSSEMEEALEHGEFHVWLQPIFTMATEFPSCAEALVRWQHPQKGLMMPCEFIPLFERNGFITKLDSFVWDETCRILRKLSDSDTEDVTISINVSRSDFYSRDVAEYLAELTKKHGVNPARIHVEITESTYADNPAKIRETLEKLHNLGFVIMLDDFGSGFSSLDMLKDTHLDILKADRGLVKDIENSERARSLLSSVIQLARRMGMSIVAEGVETRLQADILRAMHCDMAQGFYYSKPIPEDKFLALISDSRN